MILGTHTSRAAQDYLMIAEVILPKARPIGTGADESGDVLRNYDEGKGGESGALRPAPRPRELG